MNLTIRSIGPDDTAAVVSLVQEFAEFENLSHYCEITSESLSLAMFGDDAVVEGSIALIDDEPVGYALYFPYFASFRGQRGLYLEDIYIRPDHRGRSVGETMLRAIARRGAERGCVRLDLMVLNWNTPALRFYEKLGAVGDPDERHFKFTDDAFKALAS